MLPGISLRRGLLRTQELFRRVTLALRRPDIGPGLWEDLEELLITADVGVATTGHLLAGLQRRYDRGDLRTTEAIEEALRLEMAALLQQSAGARAAFLPPELTLVLVVGVNGVGKTTTVAKLGEYWRTRGRRVLLVAADTFRAAGAEQLHLWAERAGLPCIVGRQGGDPGAVVFDGVTAARARGLDLALVDTAGRFHTKTNLMEELGKLRRIAERQEVATQSLLVLDASTGHNGVIQARAFQEALGPTGIVVTKLDGTAKGGAIFSIGRELGAAVLFLGTGQGIEDLLEFDGEAFVAALFESPE